MNDTGKEEREEDEPGLRERGKNERGKKERNERGIVKHEDSKTRQLREG